MTAFMATNRILQPTAFGNGRNASGNTWWTAPDKPFDRVSDWTEIDRAAALAQIKAIGKPVVLFIHGFNNSWVKDMDTFQAVRDGLGDTFTPVPFSWDSEGSPLEYLQDRVRAEQSADDLLEAMRDLECPNVIAHSMGNYLLQTALDRAGTAPCVRNLVMVAADVDFDALDKSQISQLAANGTVLWSYRDGALQLSSDLHLAVRLGLVGPGRTCPKNFRGVNCTLKMPLTIIDPLKIHGFYFQSAECLGLMREALQ